MTKDEVIALAREAGLVYCAMDGWTSPTPENKYPEGVEQEPLERFAALVAEHERQACAQIAKQWDIDHPSTNFGGCIAAAIRSRTCP